jgi:hypothetical protein
MDTRRPREGGGRGRLTQQAFSKPTAVPAFAGMTKNGITLESRDLLHLC